MKQFILSRRQFLQKSAKTTAGLVATAPLFAPTILKGMSKNDTIGIGVIGLGIRSRIMLHRLGYVHPQAAPNSKGFGTISRQDRTRGYGRPDQLPKQPFDNVEIRGVCDIYDDALEYGREMFGRKVEDYRDYRKLLENKDIDAVLIFTPDHWHARMAIDACEAGKDIFIEKCPTNSYEQGVAVRNAALSTGRVVQLNESGLHSPVHKKVKEVINSGILGNVYLIRTYKYISPTRRLWEWPIPEDVSPETVDWNAFLGDAPYREFDPKRYIRWRCYWDYATGVVGDLFSHTISGVNDVMDIHIPDSAVAMGSVTEKRDYFEVPDLFHSVYEYPDKDLTLTFSANFSSIYAPRSVEYLGTNATLTTERNTIKIWGDPGSERYKDSDGLKKWDKKKPTEVIEVEIDEDAPGTSEIHYREFFEAIITGGETTCDIDMAFGEDITCHLATQAYLSGKKVSWDKTKQKIV